jgi:hypothetical protein
MEGQRCGRGGRFHNGWRGGSGGRGGRFQNGWRGGIGGRGGHFQNGWKGGSGGHFKNGWRGGAAVGAAAYRTDVGTASAVGAATSITDGGAASAVRAASRPLPEQLEGWHRRSVLLFAVLCLCLFSPVPCLTSLFLA